VINPPLLTSSGFSRIEIVGEGLSRLQRKLRRTYGAPDFSWVISQAFRAGRTCRTCGAGALASIRHGHALRVPGAFRRRTQISLQN
jgi:hypothetical protein